MTTSIGETARGDREQRRRDVLVAAASVLEERGWDDFSIREIAARAGVSGGAVYQWFSGKGEIWAQLQTARFTADTATVESWPADLGPSETVHRLVMLIAKNHVDLGRHRFEFVRGLKGRAPAYADDLTNAHARLSASIADRLLSIYGDGHPPENHAARVSWLWAVGKGVGDHMVDSRFEAMGVDRTDFLDTTAECLLAGLRAPSPATVRSLVDRERR
ncbi:MAG: TetR/AcrR family transcriptional regulator [Acidimicrobiales bacterium]